ncbi:MAG: hypothetical protein AAFQ80_05520 [Cyanobacteria bacterium J06621_8]
MPIDCIGSESFRLNYQIGGIQQTVNVLYPGIGNDPDYYKARWVGQIGEVLTFKVEKDLSKDKYIATGTFTDISADGDGETLYFRHFWINEEIRESFELTDARGYWYAIGEIKDDGSGANTRRFGYAYEISADAYAQIKTEDNDSPVGGSSQRINRPNPTGFTAYPGADNLDSREIYRYGYSTFDVTIYANDELVSIVPTIGSREIRYEPSDDIAVIDEFESIQDLSQVFSKDSSSQGVEVLLAPDSPHKKEVWLVDFDEDGDETGRRVIFDFELLLNQGTPQHSVECIYDNGDCPEGSCAVNCGTHMCCYNANGEPVHHYEL